MKTLEQKLGTVHIIIAVLAAFFISINGRWNQIGEAIVSPFFYFAVSVSFCIALVLLLLVQVGNKFLNKHFPWHGRRYLRMFYQIILCIVVPAVLDILFITIYFKVIGNTSRLSDFLNFDFPIVVAMLVIVNLYYVSTLSKHNAGTVENDKISHDHHLAEQKDTLVISHCGTYVHLRINEDILCLLKEGRYITVLTLAGDEYRISDTMSVLQNRYQHTNLHRINRSAFINAQCIIGYHIGETPRTLEIVIDPAYRQLVSPQRKDFLTVTGDHIPVIRHLFQEQD